jgi:hypothetical protein
MTRWSTSRIRAQALALALLATAGCADGDDTGAQFNFCERLAAERLDVWFVVEAVPTVTLTGDGGCVLKLAEGASIAFNNSSRDDLEDQLNQLEAADPGGLEVSSEFWSTADGNIMTAAINGSLVVIAEIEAAAEQYVQSGPISVNSLMKFVLSGRRETSESTHDQQRSGLLALAPVTPVFGQCGSSIDAINADGTALLSLNLELEVGPTTQTSGTAEAGAGFVGSVSFGSSLDINRCNDVFEEPLPGRPTLPESTWIIVAGTIDYEIAPGAECLRATATAIGLIARTPDGVEVPIPTTQLVNENFHFYFAEVCYYR